MSAFEPDEIVDVFLRGVRVTKHEPSDEGDSELTVLLDCEAGSSAVQIPYAWPMVTVERVVPAEWPPQMGDIWRDGDGDLWFAVYTGNRDASAEPGIEFVLAAGGDPCSPKRVVEKCRPLTLVHREAAER